VALTTTSEATNENRASFRIIGFPIIYARYSGGTPQPTAEAAIGFNRGVSKHDDTDPRNRAQLGPISPHMLRIPRKVALYRLVLLVLVALGSSAPISASAQDDSRPPSQALASDPAPPIPRLSATVDPVGAAFGEWTARLELAVLPAHAVFIEGGYRDGDLAAGIGIELGYHLFFVGDGLDGPFVGMGVGIAVTTDRADVSTYGALEAGWQLALGPIALGLAGGVEAHIAFAQDAEVSDVAWAPRISVLVGYVLR